MSIKYDDAVKGWQQEQEDANRGLRPPAFAANANDGAARAAFEVESGTTPEVTDAGERKEDFNCLSSCWRSLYNTFSIMYERSFCCCCWTWVAILVVILAIIVVIWYGVDSAENKICKHWYRADNEHCDMRYLKCYLENGSRHNKTTVHITH